MFRVPGFIDGPLSSHTSSLYVATDSIKINAKNIFQIAENVLKTYFSSEIFCSTILRI